MGEVGLAVFIGAITFTGSIIAFLKLDGRMSGKPIILHVMDIYSRFGFRDFIVAGGYKCMMIKSYFHNFHLFWIKEE